MRNDARITKAENHPKRYSTASLILGGVIVGCLSWVFLDLSYMNTPNPAALSSPLSESSSDMSISEFSASSVSSSLYVFDHEDLVVTSLLISEKSSNSRA
ncbi:hypothetical protein Tco_0321662 [Tanacetum coccineum]